MCLVWISEQTAIISLYGINWLVFITETECLLSGAAWVFIYNSGYSQYLAISGHLCKPHISYDVKIFDVLKLEALLEKLMVTQLVKISNGFNWT